MLFLYAKDKLVLNACADLLQEFDVKTYTNADELKADIDAAKVILIDDDVALAETLSALVPSKTLILLTVASDSLDGADFTVLQKPVSFRFLLQKIQFLMSMAKKGLTLMFETPFYTFNGSTRTLLNQKTKQDIRLTEKEAEIIQFLYENKDKIVSKDDLLCEIFGYKSGVETHTVETHIYKLRQKVGDEGENLIATVEGGYHLKEA